MSYPTNRARRGDDGTQYADAGAATGQDGDLHSRAERSDRGAVPLVRLWHGRAGFALGWSDNIGRRTCGRASARVLLQREDAQHPREQGRNRGADRDHAERAREHHRPDESRSPALRRRTTHGNGRHREGEIHRGQHTREPVRLHIDHLRRVGRRKGSAHRYVRGEDEAGQRERHLGRESRTRRSTAH